MSKKALFLHFFDKLVHGKGVKVMKTKKKIIALGMGLLIAVGTISTASAYVYTVGTHYQTVTHNNIPSSGYSHFDTYYGSKKATDGYFATFKKLKGDAWLGNFAELIDSSKRARSIMIGIPLNKADLAEEKGCSKGTVYFSAVASHGLEPSNSCSVTMDFSADNLK